MPRPIKPRHVCHRAGASFFKPNRIPMRRLEELLLPSDALEAMRLVDFEALSFADAGVRMGVSRSTIGRLLEEGRKTVVDALLHGKALRIATETSDGRDLPPCCCGSGRRRR